MKKRVDGCIVESINDYVSCGVTNPLDCRLTNGAEAYVKYARNPFGPRVLVNEWIGNSIADCFEIEIPFYGMVTFSEAAIEECAYLGVRFDSTKTGFCSIKIPDLVPISSNMITKDTIVDIAKIILFHCIVGEEDSHEGNMLYDLKADTVYILDSSHIFGKEIHKSAEQLLHEYVGNLDVERYFRANLDMYQMVGFENRGKLAEELMSTARVFEEKLTNREIGRIINDIPDRWKEIVGEKLLDAYEEILAYRMNYVEKIAQEIIVEGGI